MPNDKPWHRFPKGLRETIFMRDSIECQIKLPGCTRQAQELDHIVSPMYGGSWFDPSNLQASCRPCNRKKGATPKYPAYPHAW